MKHFVLTVVIALLAVAHAYADKTDNYIRAEMEKREIPGLAVTVIQNGKTTKTATYGYADLEWKNKVTKETVFEIGSTTKQFTASAIMLLVQEGKLSLDDKISKHLKNTPSHWNDITVRHLLNHTSGIRSYTGISNGKGFELTERLTQDQFIQLIGTHPLENQPGETWKYCNSAYNLLGYIIENRSGKTYFEFLGERIFNPLGMTATTNREPSILIPFRAKGYEKNRQGNRVNRDYDLTDIWAAGAVVSTVSDMAKWDAALNSEKILSTSSKNEMWTLTRLKNGTTKNYGLGWYVDTLENHKNIGHSGSTSGFSASFQRFPDNKLTIILFCNSGEGGVATTLAKKIATFYLPETVVKR